ncbi:hypothetical protein STEG23_003113 [Scotinomys teguina]
MESLWEYRDGTDNLPQCPHSEVWGIGMEQKICPSALIRRCGVSGWNRQSAPVPSFGSVGYRDGTDNLPQCPHSEVWGIGMEQTICPSVPSFGGVGYRDGTDNLPQCPHSEVWGIGMEQTICPSALIRRCGKFCYRTLATCSLSWYPGRESLTLQVTSTCNTCTLAVDKGASQYHCAPDQVKLCEHGLLVLKPDLSFVINSCLYTTNIRVAG